MKAVIVIPARLESKRLERKLLLNETGKTLLQHTWEQAKKTGLDVYVATDSDEIGNAVAMFADKPAWRTSSECQNGTERVAEVAKDLVDVDVFVNWQADEPEIDPDDVTRLVQLDARDSCLSYIATLAGLITYTQAGDPNRTKVVLNNAGQAMYFSRARIPHCAGQSIEHLGVDVSVKRETSERLVYWQHIGIYAYRRHALKEIAKSPLRDIETTESLEQLRWLMNCYTIDISLIDDLPQGINTREDYDAFVERQKVMA